MSIELKPAIIPPWLKMGFFGNTGSGKTKTSSKTLCQLIAKFCKHSQLAMFDTEPSGGFIADMVKDLTGKELLTITSRSFSDMMDFVDLCIEKKYVGLIDSITHPWRNLCSDYLEAKKSRVRSAGGNDKNVKLSLKDWGPLKEIWNQFSEKFTYSPAHLCVCGREGDVWDTVVDEEGKEEIKKTGVKMKTETEFGFESSLLIQMKFEFNKHIAYVVKDRFDVITGKTSDNNPDIDFFMPHISKLNIGGKNIEQSKGKKIFDPGSGPNWETIKKQRDAILENIKDDIVLLIPGKTTEAQKLKIKTLRQIFDTSSWTEIENDNKKYDIKTLKKCRENLKTINLEK